MQKKFRSNNIFAICTVLATAFFYPVCICHSPVIAQQNTHLSNDYKGAILQKIDSLLVTKYVLPEMAKKYADEFRKNMKMVFLNHLTMRKNLLTRLRQISFILQMISISILES